MTEDERTAVDLLAGVARGLIELTSVAQTAMFRLPYPSSLQLALDRVVLAGLTRHMPTPGGVPELLSWCRERRPADWWPLELPVGFLTADARLIHSVGDEATRTCAELASYGRDGVLEQEAETLLAELANTCGTVERFAACRDFLISRPVILQYNPIELLGPAVAHTWKLVQHLYVPVPDRFRVHRVVHRCTGCLLLAKPVTADASWCEGGCQPEGRVLESSHQPEQARALPLGLRLFLALPGRTERAVRSGLDRQTRLLPQGLGLHRVTSPDGNLCVFQVQDREQPIPAALRAAEAAAELHGPLDIVAPDRLAASPGYRENFEYALSDGADVRLLSVSEFTGLRPAGRERNDHA
ncbi:hypothetical protein ACFWOB_38325 [Streptomyces sp. NPDC058420]|uniref:pPIWI_RE_Y domain-containing protein n=1 Tax=Streptomyces sp. NPDC058420 TaxID=3346489 RepID=UPI003663B2AE